MGDVIAPAASVTGTSVPRQILLPVDLHSSRAGRHLFKPHTEMFPFSTPPSSRLESIHCCSWSYYRYAPAKCKTSICHLSAHQLSSIKTSDYATQLLLHFQHRWYWSYFWSIWGLMRKSLISKLIYCSKSPKFCLKITQLQHIVNYLYNYIANQHNSVFIMNVLEDGGSEINHI